MFAVLRHSLYNFHFSDLVAQQTLSLNNPRRRRAQPSNPPFLQHQQAAHNQLVTPILVLPLATHILVMRYEKTY